MEARGGAILRVKPPYGGGSGVLVYILGPRNHGPGPGPWAQTQDRGQGAMGPGLLAWARPRDHSPGQSKKHDSTMKMIHFLQNDCFSWAFRCFLGRRLVDIFKNIVFFYYVLHIFWKCSIFIVLSYFLAVQAHVPGPGPGPAALGPMVQGLGP